MDRMYFSANKSNRLIFCSLRPLLGRLSVRPGTLETEMAVKVLVVLATAAEVAAISDVEVSSSHPSRTASCDVPLLRQTSSLL